MTTTATVRSKFLDETTEQLENGDSVTWYTLARWAQNDSRFFLYGQVTGRYGRIDSKRLGRSWWVERSPGTSQHREVTHDELSSELEHCLLNYTSHGG